MSWKFYYSQKEIESILMSFDVIALYIDEFLRFSGYVTAMDTSKRGGGEAKTHL